MRIRIGTKLLLTYVALIGLVLILAGVLVPGWVELSVTRAERDRLRRQADSFARLISERSGHFRGRLGGLPPALMSAELLVDDTLLIMDEQGIVHRSTRRELQGKRLDPTFLEQLSQARSERLFRETLPTLPGLGPVVVEMAPISGAPGWRVVLLRETAYIKTLARPITFRLFLVVGMVLFLSLFVGAWLSRDLVRRLAATGAAARALSEGDLSTRAPEQGGDEVTELAGHFNYMAQRLQTLVEGLRRSERLRKELLITVSHELRTPMTSIAGFAEALRDGVVQDPSQKQRYYEIIANESARLTRLIADVFDIAKLEAGQVDLKLQVLPVAAWLLEVAEGFEPVIAEAGVRLELDISPEAERARIHGDRDRLRQVLGNLLSNALRFSPVGEVVTVRAAVAESDVVISVTDHGPGLGPGEAERVFERFYQGDQRQNGHKGAGLGLSIVKSLVEAQGGVAGVDSVPGQGASFWFRLKRAD